MSFTKLWDAGFKQLVSVTRPGGKLSPLSRLDPADMGKAPGRKNGAGLWAGYNWRATQPDRKTAADWEASGANVGLNAASFPGLDIDVSHETLAQVVMKFAREHLGPAPVRLSRDPRRLLPYRTSEPFTRMSLTVTLGGEKQLIELLGNGQQYLVAGKHPSGVEYRWEGKPLWAYKPEQLAEITREDAERFFDALSSALASAGLEVHRSGSGLERTGSSDTSMQAPSIEKVREVVRLIPNPLEWGWYEHVRMGHAIRAACGEENEGDALEIWEEWCDRWEGESNGERARWESMSPPHSVGWSWLQEQAEEHSDYMSAQDEFEADPEAGPPPASLSAPAALEIPVTPDGQKVKVEPGVELSDVWAVDRIHAQVAKTLRYSPARKGWYVWAGHRWQFDEVLAAENQIELHLRRLAVRLSEQAAAAPTKEEGKPYQSAAKRFQSATGIDAITSLLKRRVAFDINDLDADPMLLCTPGGVVDLTSGEMRPVDPDDLMSRSVAVAPRPGPTPLWDRFLDDITGGDSSYKWFLQKLFGYFLTGRVDEKIICYAWGGTDTGKSTLVRFLTALFDTYADSVSVSAFISREPKEGNATANLARLPGARLVTATEPAQGQAWDESRVKSVSGGDDIEAKFLYGQPFRYRPKYKVLIVGNHEPMVQHIEEAMIRRIRILPMDRSIPVEQQIDRLEERMMEEEGPAILHWMIEGCLAWQREGLEPPAVVQRAIEEYWSEQDALRQWVREECVIEEGAQAHRQDMYEAFSIWCRRRGERPGTAHGFRALFRPIVEEFGLKDREVDINGNRRKGYIGIRLKPRVAMGTEVAA